MSNLNPERQILISAPRTNDGLFFLLTIQFHIFISNKLLGVPEYAEMQHYMMMHFDITMTLLDYNFMNSNATNVQLLCDSLGKIQISNPR